MKLKEDKTFYFDDKAADRVVYFIENHIKHIKGEIYLVGSIEIVVLEDLELLTFVYQEKTESLH